MEVELRKTNDDCGSGRQSGVGADLARCHSQSEDLLLIVLVSTSLNYSQPPPCLPADKSHTPNECTFNLTSSLPLLISISVKTGRVKVLK